MAAAHQVGAGDLAIRFSDRVHLALVLEPDVSRETSQLMFLLAQAAATEALAAIAPPETDIVHRWTGEVVVNGAIVGSVSGHIAPPAAEDDIPDWLVLGVRLELRPKRGAEPGHQPDRSSLVEEWGDIDTVDLVEAIARHWMGWLHRWEADGWARAAKEWNMRRAPNQRIAHGHGFGTLVGTDEIGNALIDVEGTIQSVPLATRWDVGA